MGACGLKGLFFDSYNDIHDVECLFGSWTEGILAELVTGTWSEGQFV